MPSPNKGPFPNSLSSVAAVAPDDVWAVGTWFTKAFDDRTLTLHWDGTAWHRVKSPNAGPASAANDLVSVSAVTTDDVWAVGMRGLKTLTMHWDGTAWSVVRSPTPGGNADLGGVVAIGSDDAWAVGGFVDRDANAVRTLVEHWNGSTWSVVESANKGPSDNHLWGISAVTGRMLAVGERFKGGGTGPVVPLSLERCGPVTPGRARACRRGHLQSLRAPVPYRRPTSNPPATSRRRSRSSPRASRPASRT